jgi:hydrogenase maturation protease
MAHILILGYGNPLRSDDGLGWRAAEELSRTLSSPHVEVLARHQLTPELADAVRQADAVFFIDATRDGEPGELTCEPVSPLPTNERFSHQLSPAGILALARQLYGACPRAFLVSLCGECFDYGEKLSPRIAAGLPHLTALVAQAAHQFERYGLHPQGAR